MFGTEWFGIDWFAVDNNGANANIFTPTNQPNTATIPQQPTYTDARGFIGAPNVPWEVRYQRQTSADVYRMLGTPVLIKRMYTAEDVANGTAVKSVTMDDIYGQSSYWKDFVSHGVGFVSPQTQPGEWIGIPPGGDQSQPELFVSETQPYPHYIPAPKYRGYGPGFLTYAILPDRPEDQWKLTPQGALIRQQTAMIQLPWWPQVGDNDLVIVCELDPTGRITQTFERYQLKMTSPVTLHGIDQRGGREFNANANNNRYWVGQQAELTKVPAYDQIYHVEIDR